MRNNYRSRNNGLKSKTNKAMNINRLSSMADTRTADGKMMGAISEIDHLKMNGLPKMPLLPSQMTKVVIDGRYEVCNKIGNGSFGILYQGVDSRTGEGIAIKLESVKTT